MKKTVLIVWVVIISATVHGQELLSSSKELGLISYLTTIKSVAEYKMISIATDPQYTSASAKVKSFQSEYNLLKLTVDRLINQTVADMAVSNKLRTYKKMNKLIKGDIDSLPKNMQAYKKVLEEIEGRIETFLLKSYSSMAAGPSIEDVLGIIELTHGIITDSRDFREKKVANLSNQLKELKLKALKELTVEDKEK